MARMPFFDTDFDYEIIEGNICITNGDFRLCMSIPRFERGSARAARVIAEYRARNADVIQLPAEAFRREYPR